MPGEYWISVYLHILLALVWIGSMVFLGIGILPLLRREEYRNLAPRFLTLVGIRLRYLGWTAILGLIVTGLFNLHFRGVLFSQLLSTSFWSTPYGRILGTKLLFVLLLVGVTLIHDLALGPAATRILEEAPDSPKALRLRKQASLLGRVAVGLSLVILYWAIRLVRG